MDALSSTQKMPSHIAAAAEMMATIKEMTHREQVEVFNFIRQNILEFRKEQAACMQAENENREHDLKEHFEGSNKIASGL